MTGADVFHLQRTSACR